MNSQNDRENELARRERELQAREQAIRLQELEAEINQPWLSETVKHQQPKDSLKQWYGKLVNTAKFLGIVIAVVVAIRLAFWLATVIMIGGIAWMAYKIFWEGDRAKN